MRIGSVEKDLFKGKWWWRSDATGLRKKMVGDGAAKPRTLYRRNKTYQELVLRGNGDDIRVAGGAEGSRV